MYTRHSSGEIKVVFLGRHCVSTIQRLSDSACDNTPAPFDVPSVFRLCSLFKINVLHCGWEVSILSKCYYLRLPKATSTQCHRHSACIGADRKTETCAASSHISSFPVSARSSTPLPPSLSPSCLIFCCFILCAVLNIFTAQT